MEDGTSWPHPERGDELEWRMRHAPNDMTQSEIIAAAEFVSMYSLLVRHPSWAKALPKIRRAIARAAQP